MSIQDCVGVLLAVIVGIALAVMNFRRKEKASDELSAVMDDLEEARRELDEAIDDLDKKANG